MTETVSRSGLGMSAARFPGEFVDDPTYAYRPWGDGSFSPLYVPMVERVDGDVLTADDELWFADSGTRLVYFTGMDAFHSFAIIGTAMLMALGGYVLVDRWITNEFYELENDKFSTSRGHVVSGRVLATEVPRDLIRYHLAATSPEFQRTNFTREALARVTRI
ncbi:class I tRNA ligase family protein, partial [Kibdelosporangium lantanae]